eukprot:COSAG02_NODE_271_length_26364_cov_13.423018_8_plen_393_part_00
MPAFPFLPAVHALRKQGLELVKIQVDGKPVARLRFDCRSLIRVRTNAAELLSKPLYGWVSMYSSLSSDVILLPVPKEHLQVTKKTLKARGGFVDPSTLRKAATAVKSSSEAPKSDIAKPRTGDKGKVHKAAKPTSDKEAEAVAERSQSRKALTGLKEGTNESKAESHQAKKALAGLKEGKNESKAESHQAKKALAGLKEGKNESKAESHQAKKALAGLKDGKNESKAETHQAKKALAGLKDGKNESKAETHQKKKAMDAFKSPRKPKADVDPAVRAFLEDALQELCTTQPDHPLHILAQKCRDKAAALGSERQAPGTEEEVGETPTKTASGGSMDSAMGPVTTVEEAVRRLKKYEDIGALGVKKLVLHVRGCTSFNRQPSLLVRSCLHGVVS